MQQRLPRVAARRPRGAEHIAEWSMHRSLASELVRHVERGPGFEREPWQPPSESQLRESKGDPERGRVLFQTPTYCRVTNRRFRRLAPPPYICTHSY